MGRVEGTCEEPSPCITEGIRQKNYERRKAHRRFFSDPYRYGKALLDPPKSGELRVDMGELEEHLTNTYSDDLRHIPLQVRRDIPAFPYQYFQPGLKK